MGKVSVKNVTMVEDKEILERISTKRYWTEFKGDWRGYLENVFQWDTIPKRNPKKRKSHPFEKWIE